MFGISNRLRLNNNCVLEYLQYNKIIVVMTIKYDNNRCDIPIFFSANILSSQVVVVRILLNQ